MCICASSVCLRFLYIPFGIVSELEMHSNGDKVESGMKRKNKLYTIWRERRIKMAWNKKWSNTFMNAPIHACMNSLHCTDSVFAMSALLSLLLLLFKRSVYIFPYRNRTMYIILCHESFVCSVLPFYVSCRHLSFSLIHLLASSGPLYSFTRFPVTFCAMDI